MQQFLLLFHQWNMVAMVTMVDSYGSVVWWNVGGRLTECHIYCPWLPACEKILTVKTQKNRNNLKRDRVAELIKMVWVYKNFKNIGPVLLNFGKTNNIFF